MIWLNLLGSLFGSFSLYLLSVFVWKNALKREGILFFCGFCFFYATFAGTSFIQDTVLIMALSDPSEHRLLLEKIGDYISYISLIMGVLSVAALFGFSQEFPDKRQLLPTWVSGLVWVCFFVFFVLAVFFVVPVGPYEAFYVVPPFFSVYGLFLTLVFFLIGINFFWKTYQLREQRSGLIVIGLGLTVFLLGALIGNVIIPMFNIFDWCWIGRVLGAVFAFSVFVSVTSYKTFRIKTAVPLHGVLGVQPLGVRRAAIRGFVWALRCFFAWENGVFSGVAGAGFWVGGIGGWAYAMDTAPREPCVF